MLLVAKTSARVSRVAALAAVLTFGALPADAGESTIRAALEAPGASFLSGLQGCGHALGEGMPEGSRCLGVWSVNQLLLDAATRFATEQGRAVFGEHFRIVNSLTYSPEGNGLGGGIDVVLPLAASTPGSGTASATGAFFLQQGITRWVDDHGFNRNDLRLGAVRRFSLSEEDDASGLLGVSAFVQQSYEFEHTRLVAGADYAGRWGRGTLNLFVPTTGWQPTQRGYEERALSGIELGLRLDLTTTLFMRTAVGHWEDDDGLGGWSSNGRMAVGWRPHPWLKIGASWNGIGTHSESQAFRLAVSLPFGGTGKAPQWEGLGLVGGGENPSTVDAWNPVENIDVIQVARRETTTNLVSRATVRFLQDSANSGDQIGIEVLLPAATTRDLNLVVTLAPGAGDNPAVPGVDYVDEPVPVVIRAGTSSAIVNVQLPLNAELNESRSLSVTVSLAS